MIQDFLKERKSVSEYSEAQRKAITIFEKQKDSIKKIKGTQGFREIMDYLGREIEACDNRMDSAKNQEGWKEAYAVRKTCNGLKMFLNNLANS